MKNEVKNEVFYYTELTGLMTFETEFEFHKTVRTKIVVPSKTADLAKIRFYTSETCELLKRKVKLQKKSDEIRVAVKNNALKLNKLNSKLSYLKDEYPHEFI